MKLKVFKTYMILMTIIAFIGFCFEDLWMLIRYQVIDNRNSYLPFLLGYGFFIVVIYYILGTPHNLFRKYDIKKPYNFIIYFSLAFILVSVAEIILGTYVEKVGGFYYWNYINIPFHFTRYTSLPTSLGFAMVITVFMDYFYIPLREFVKKISDDIPLLLVVIMTLILVLDMNVSFSNMCNNNGKNIIWSINLK